MKIIFILFFFFTTIAQALIYRNGIIEKDEYWTLMESPVIINSDLTIKKSAVLYIKRGVKVYIDKNVKISVYGGLRIDGYKDQPVIFTPRHKKRWEGIYFYSANDAKCRIRSLILKKANYGIYSENTSFSITNSAFINCKVGAFLDKRSDMVFYNNVFDSSEYCAIFIKNSHPVIMSNIFINSFNYAILGEKNNANMQPDIEYNLFWNNYNKDIWNINDDFLGIPTDSCNNVPCDKYSNLYTDPIFKGSQSEKIKIIEDLKKASIDTIKINDKGFIENFLTRKKDIRIPQRYNKGYYLLSPYSPCIDAGLPGIKFLDEDSTRNDIGLYGGPYYPLE